MNNFYFTKILKESWSFAFKNIKLWFLAMFILSGFGSFIFSLIRYTVNEADLNVILSSLRNFLFYSESSLFIFLMFGFFVLAAFFISIIASVSLVLGIDKVFYRKKLLIKKEVKKSFSYLIRIINLEIFYFFTFLIFFFGLLVPFLIYLDTGKNNLALIFGFLFFAVQIFLFFLFGLTKHFTLRYIVLKNNGPLEAFKKSCLLLSRSFRTIIFVFILKFLISLFFVLFYLFCILIIAAPFLLLGIIFSTIFGAPQIGLVFFVLLILAITLFYFLYRGFCQTFYNYLLSLTFYSLEE